MAFLSVGLAIGFVTGYTARELRQYSKTYVLNDLYVIRKDSDERFLLAFNDTHLPFEVNFCTDYKPTFQPGMMLSVLIYEDRGECWSVANQKLGYKYARDSYGKILKVKGE